MRATSSTSWARWATCALAPVLAIAIAIPVASANRTPRSLESCTAFDQSDKGEDKVEFTIHNTCTIPIDCAISWRVVCAPDSRKRRASHPSSTKLALLTSSSGSAEASASVCGDDGWVIDQIQWNCQPNKD